MAGNPEEYCRLRSEFIDAAVKYEEYETFIQKTAHNEERDYESGRNLPVGLIRWPYKPWRKCWILAPRSGTNEEPFSTMQKLFSKAWLWLPRVIADEVADTAEMHLSEPPSPPTDTALFWARSNYQYWCWLLWFHWLRQWREANPKEAGKPSQKMVLAPFHCSADLIAQWGLDGSAGTIPDWLAPPSAPDPESPSDGKPEGSDPAAASEQKHLPNGEFGQSDRKNSESEPPDYMLKEFGRKQLAAEIFKRIWDGKKHTYDDLAHVWNDTPRDDAIRKRVDDVAYVVARNPKWNLKLVKLSRAVMLERPDESRT